jgi:nucleosome binding factor SPN SPT16 subunit
VILAIGAGVLLAGIVGALFAVPLVAVVNVVVTYLSGSEDDQGAHPDEEVVGPLADGTEESSDDEDDADESSEDAEEASNAEESPETAEMPEEEQVSPAANALTKS